MNLILNKIINAKQSMNNIFVARFLTMNKETEKLLEFDQDSNVHQKISNQPSLNSKTDHNRYELSAQITTRN